MDIEITTNDFIEDAEKASNIVFQTIRDGEYDALAKRLDEITSASQGRRKYVFDAPHLTRWIVMLLIAIFAMACFAYFLLVAIGTFVYSDAFRIVAIYGLTMVGCIYILNMFMVAKSIREIRFSKRYAIYLNVLTYRNTEIIDDLAAFAKFNRRTVVRDLNKAIMDKLIPQGHFGSNKVIFMVSDSSFKEYSDHRAAYDRYINKLIEERKRMVTRSPETEDLLQKGQEYVQRIRDRNDIIKDMELSNKIDRLEKLVAAILREVDVNPKQGEKLGTFMNDYLFATENLLEAYIEHGANVVKGNNTEIVQMEISDSINSLSETFETLLGRFCQEQEREVTREVYAMEVTTNQDWG